MQQRECCALNLTVACTAWMTKQECCHLRFDIWMLLRSAAVCNSGPKKFPRRSTACAFSTRDSRDSSGVHALRCAPTTQDYFAWNRVGAVT